jgi:UPF0755 protein
MKYFTWIVIFFLAACLVIETIHAVNSFERSTAKRPEVSVTIPEGSTINDIDRILSDNTVLARGDFMNATSVQNLEGRLFPDTYDFFTSSTPEAVVQKMTDNFNLKAEPLLATAGTNASSDLIIASILEKEVATSTDWAIVAGILEKRLAIGMPLDVDATICYIKDQEEAQKNLSLFATSTLPAPCVLTAADLKIDSPYNTYLYKGLPPAPIDNPGLATIEAALHPATSSYLYYLTDPKTGKTMYAVTLAQQEANQKKYLQ